MPISPDDKPVQSFWKTVQEVFPHVAWDDFCRALDVTYHIQHGIKGRHCGNLGDKASQYLAVVEYARACAPSRLDSLEVGTLFGGSCLMKLFALRDLGIPGKIVCIDPMSGFYGQETDLIAGLPVTREIFLENVKHFGFPPEAVELRQCRSDEPEALEGLEKSHFATVLIDGDHSYEGVRNDWRSYSPFVANLGIILIDDYAEPAWPQVTVFVHELQNSVNRLWDRSGIVGTTFIVCRGLLARENQRGANAAEIVSLEQVVRQGRTGALKREDLLDGLRPLVEENLNMRLGKVYLSLAKDSLRENHYGECEGWLHRLLELENMNFAEKFNGFFQLGRCKLMQGDTAEAIGNFQIAMNIPFISIQDLFAVTLELGSAFVKIKEHSKAEVLYLRCLKSAEIEKSQTYHLYVRLGNLYWAEQKVKEAERYYTMALAVEGIEEARRFHPFTGLAKAFAMNKRFAEAEKIFSAALAIGGVDNENRAKALIELVKCYQEQGKRREAIRALTSLNGLPGLNPVFQRQVHIEIGETWISLGGLRQSRREFQ